MGQQLWGSRCRCSWPVSRAVRRRRGRHEQEPRRSRAARSVTKISLLEQVRFERDEIELTWDGATFSLDETLRTVQEAITPPERSMFDTVLAPPIFISIGPQDQELQAALGKSTYITVQCTNAIGQANSLFLTGIAATSGNVDGMVVCITLLSPNNATDVRCRHESLASAPANRFANVDLALRSSRVNGWVMYRYSGSIQRWIAIT